MAEREDPTDGTEDTEPAGDETGREAPLDEEAVWAQIVASYGRDPEPGEGGWPDAEDLPDDPAPPGVSGLPMNDGIPVIPRAYVVHSPVGPRDFPPRPGPGHDADDPDNEDGDDAHFVPPEPPPLPPADVTTKFAWLAVLGGPALLLLYVLTGQDIPSWALVAGVGGFLGGFATLVARMNNPDEEDDDPHGGAVV